MSAPTLIAPEIRLIEGEAVTTSRALAQYFNKQHLHVLEKVRKLDCSPGFTESNFRFSEYKDTTGRSLPEYHITRDGFVFLAMGFTGKKAAQFKEAYIDAFNRMEQQLRHSTPSVDYTAILRATIHGRAQALPKHKRIGAIHKIWIQLRQRYRVSSGTDIPASKVSEACRYVASCTLADAHLPKQSELLEQERSTPVPVRTQPLQETQLERLHQLTNYVESLEKHAPAVQKAALALDSKLLVEVGETLREGRKLVQGISGTVAFVGGPLHGRTIELARPPGFFVIADNEGPQKYQLMMSGDGRNTYFQYQGLAH